MTTITLGRYLWERIKEIGVSTILVFVYLTNTALDLTHLVIQGVPGDFNLTLLDKIFEVEGLRWVGNGNELNAAYAADGYSRIKGIPGVLVTTFGVGELSALNGVAGSYAEQVKIIHVVGQTTRKMQRDRTLMHHCIDNNPDHQCFNQMSRNARVATAELQDIKTAPSEIDRVIRECFVKSRPVYIFLPMDMVDGQIPISLLDSKIDLQPTINHSAQDTAVSEISKALKLSKNPCFLIDGLVHRHGAIYETKQLVEKLNIPVYCTNMGKTVIDNNHEYFVGVYNGSVSLPGVAKAFSRSDLVIVLGSVPADTNTAGFTRKIDRETCCEINVNPFDVLINDRLIDGIFMKCLLTELCRRIPDEWIELPMPILPVPIAPKLVEKHRITQDWFWNRISQFFRPNDVVLSDPGTSAFGLYSQTFPQGCSFHAQTYYASIGWATPATLGATLALSDSSAVSTNGHVPQRRTILFTGDGSFMLTMQELGTIINQDLSPIIFIINNAGYTVERIIHGAQQPYNDIFPMDYSHLLALFSHPDPKGCFYRCTTPEQLELVLAKLSDFRNEHAVVVEVVVDKMDTPWWMSAQMALRGPQAVETLRREGFSGWINGGVPEQWADAEELLR